MEVDATEKVYADYELQVRSPGGHSSEPVEDNAIYRLIAGLTRLGAYQFPFELNVVSRAYYERVAQFADPGRAAEIRAILVESPEPAAVRRFDRTPKDHAYTHTTCVPTRLAAGHANNALPQLATANVNCRVLPGHSLEEVRRQLIGILADPGIEVQYVADDGHKSPTAPERHGFAPVQLDPRVMGALQGALSAAWPGRTAVATMALGASDAIYTVAAGLPTYTVSTIAVRPEDSRAHGRDERVSVDDFRRYSGFFMQFLRSLTGE
jgi:acetylornithine deacetylase/succinyl-diaminopimelate desuccinylase-like protein